MKWILTGYRNSGVINMARCDTIDELLEIVKRWAHRIGSDDIFKSLSVEVLKEAGDGI